MHFKAVFSTIIVLLIARIASGDPIGRIVGGVPMSIEQVPYQVSLQMVEPDGETWHFCGGSIISEKYILTASHCVEDLELDDLAILVGRTFNDQKAQKNQIKSIKMHRRYDSDTQNFDIALLELKTPLEFSDQIQPIPLVSASDKIPVGSKCLTSGWGDTNQRALAGNHKLRAVEVPIVNSNKCDREYAEYGGITSQMLCAGKGGKDACQGDSGGPLVCPLPSRGGEITLVGVVSWGVDCGKPNLPGVYTSLKSLRQWIRNQSGI